MQTPHQKLIESGYSFKGKTYVGDVYEKAPFTVYHSGFQLVFIREGGMIRTFPEDRLLFFSVEDMEKQTSMIARRFDGKADMTNYDYGRKIP